MLYVVRNPLLAARLFSIGEELSKLPKVETGNSLGLDRFQDFASYVKPYNGESPRESGTTWRFYDEREWRFVPDLQDFPFRYGLTKEEFNSEDKLEGAQNVLWRKSTLQFSPEDIKYIIVEREDEILEMTRRIDQIKERFNANLLQFLKFRIISSEQIREDF